MDERTAILSRMFIILGFVLLIPCALGFQLIRVNYLEGEELRALWSKQAIDQIPIPAQRGNIYDANGTLLATNAVDYRIAYDPKVPFEGGIGVPKELENKLIQKLSSLTGKSASHYR